MLFSEAMDNCYRAFPFIVPICSMGYGLISHKRIFIYYTVVSLSVDIAVFILKTKFFYPIYRLLQVDELPLLGRGTRPDGANTCGWFIDCNNPDGHGYGMPSGHSASAFVLATFWSLYLIDQPGMTKPQQYFSIGCLYLVATLVSHSRYRLLCHTYPQIILGSLIGSFIGYLSYQLWRRIEL